MNTRSGLFPALDADFVKRILRNGRFEAERLDPATLKIVAGLRLISLTEHPYVLCVYEEDPDFLEREDLDCQGRVYIESSLSSANCPDCGQPINSIGRKTKFLEVDIALDLEGIKNYLRRVLVELELATDTVSRAGRPYLDVILNDDKKVRLVLADFDDSDEESISLYAVNPSPTSHKWLPQTLELAAFLSSSSPQEVKDLWRRALAPLLGRSDLSKLLKLLTIKFSKEEIRELCFDLGVDYDDLPGEGRRDKARELIKHLERYEEIPRLISLIQQKRPNLDVPGFLGV